MKTEALPSATWNDLVFENRHKEYGAYAIRQAYQRNITVACSIMTTLIMLVILIQRISPFSSAPETDPRNFIICTLTMPDIVTVNPTQRWLPVKDTKPQANVLPRITHKEVTDASPAHNNRSTFIEPIDEIPIDEHIDFIETAIDVPPRTISCEFPLDSADIMPTFIGGPEAMARFISKHIRFPASAIQAGFEGSVYVSFVINTTGEVTDVKVLRPTTPQCDQEAIRVISKMPNWIPGKQNHAPVPVRMSLPIKFELIHN